MEDEKQCPICGKPLAILDDKEWCEFPHLHPNEEDDV